MVCILFEDYDKKFKSEILKGIENNINILKNIYEEIYLNEFGFVYCVELEKIIGIEQVKVFGKGCFMNCPKLNREQYPEVKKNIEENIVSFSGLV